MAEGQTKRCKELEPQKDIELMRIIPSNVVSYTLISMFWGARDEPKRRKLPGEGRLLSPQKKAHEALSKH